MQKGFRQMQACGLYSYIFLKTCLEYTVFWSRWVTKSASGKERMEYCYSGSLLPNQYKTSINWLSNKIRFIAMKQTTYQQTWRVLTCLSLNRMRKCICRKQNVPQKPSSRIRSICFIWRKSKGAVKDWSFINRRVQIAGFPQLKKLEEFDFSFQPQLDERSRENWRTWIFLNLWARNIILGAPGGGKTHPLLIA